MAPLTLTRLLAQAPPAENLSIFDPASPATEAIRYLFVLVLAVSAVIFLLVETVLIVSLVRHRRRAGDQQEPPQVYGSQPIEVAWTVAPMLIAFLFLLVLIRTVFEVRVDPDQPPADARPLYVKVIGHQWWWEYVYESYEGEKLDFITANELRVPASAAGVPRPVFLTLESADVAHSFWVPRLAGKTDLIPGRTNHMGFESAQPGVYLGQCAEFCGCQHANMLLRVAVEPVEQFEKWLANERLPEAPAAAAHVGKATFMKLACVNCHRIRGTPAQGTFGPDLTHLAARQTLASGMIPNRREELRAWVVDPQHIKPGCLMPAMNLTESEADQVVDYLLALE